MPKRNILNHLGEVIGELELPEGTSEETWTRKLAPYAAPPYSPGINQIVQDRLTLYRSVSNQLLIELYAQNTLAGITVEQSDALFDEYQDVILRVQQGAFPSALYRLSQKSPNGFVTQELLDTWTQKIKDYL